MTFQPPKWIKPQLTRLVDEVPTGNDWLHEIKYDGYRMHALIDGGQVRLLTRTGLDWSHRYRRTIDALGTLRMKNAYADGELCALNSDGVPAFSRLQAAMDEGRTSTAEYPDRMPAVLEEGQFEDWMRGPPELAAEMMRPYGARSTSRR